MTPDNQIFITCSRCGAIALNGGDGICSKCAFDDILGVFTGKRPQIASLGPQGNSKQRVLAHKLTSQAPPKLTED
jgi:hypothetical protein